MDEHKISLAKGDKELEETPLLSAGSPEVTKASSRRVTVEPLILIASIGFGVIFTLQPQYLKQRLADARNFSISLEDKNDCSLNKSDPNYIIEQEIQADVSSWQLIINICGFFPALFFAPIIGACGDKLGRKVAIGAPVIGYIITSVTYLLVYYFVLPLWVLAIGYFIQGTTGGYGLMLAGCYAYIADITTKENRMLRIGIIQGLFVLGMGISQVLVGLLIEVAGFGPSLWLGTFSLCAGLAYVIFPPFLIETIQRRKSCDGGHVAGLDLPSRVDSIYQLFRVNTDSRRNKLILLLLIALTTEMINQSSLNITLVYGLGRPFCWTSFVIGFYSAVTLLTSAGAMVAGTKGLSLCMSDTWILQVGMIFGVANGLLNAYAKTTLQLFLIAIFTCMRAVEQPMFHLMLSKLVEASEQGVMFACESSVLNLASFLSPILNNTTYSATVETQPGFVYLMMAVERIVPITLIIALQVITKLKPADRSSTDRIASSYHVTEDTKDE